MNTRTLGQVMETEAEFLEAWFVQQEKLYGQKTDKAILSWPFVAQYLASGAVQWVGGKILDTMFPDKSFERTMQKLLREFADVIKGIVERALADAEMKRLAALQNSIQQRLGDWLRTPEHLPILFHVHADVNDLCAGYESLARTGQGIPPIGFGPLHSAVGLNISILQSWARYSNDSRLLGTIKKTIGDWSSAVEALYEDQYLWGDSFIHLRHRTAWKNNVQGPGMCLLEAAEGRDPDPVPYLRFQKDRDHPGRRQPESATLWMVALEGTGHTDGIFFQSFDRNEAVRELKNYRTTHVRWGRPATKKKVIDPSQEIVSSWRQIPTDRIYEKVRT